MVVSRATRQTLSSNASQKIWATAWKATRLGCSTTPSTSAGCCIQASTRDFARFGQLMLNGGHVDGRPTLPDGWLEAATRKQIGIGQPGAGYGYQWWTFDDGRFLARGLYGQVIHNDPARGLVVAINSAAPDLVFSPASLQARLALFNAIRAAVDAEPKTALVPR